MSRTSDDTRAPGHADLLQRFTAGHRPALARAISIVENARPGFLVCKQNFRSCVDTNCPAQPQ